ncbi:hypothetical protein MRX96_003539 [Rhipicephalus microplus]
MGKRNALPRNQCTQLHREATRTTGDPQRALGGSFPVASSAATPGNPCHGVVLHPHRTPTYSAGQAARRLEAPLGGMTTRKDGCRLWTHCLRDKARHSVSEATLDTIQGRARHDTHSLTRSAQR